MSKGTRSARILFVEDDPNLSMILQDYLEMIGYQVEHAGDGEKGFELYNKGKFDLLILDVMMPKKDGFTLAEDIRKINPTDRIRGFQTGCDDYVTKPFSTEELKLRIKAIMKRCAVMEETDEDVPQAEVFDIGQFKFDSTNMMLRSKHSERRLTRKETSLLRLLCLNMNNLLPRDVALETIWGENDYFIGRSMDVFITKLRKYLKDDPDVRITNVHGIGFKLEVKNESMAGAV
jgi:DNA-binding response OmpR family regulator